MLTDLIVYLKYFLDIPIGNILNNLKIKIILQLSRYKLM